MVENPAATLAGSYQHQTDRLIITRGELEAKLEAERQRCMAAVCWACAQNLPLETDDDGSMHHSDGRNYSELCKAQGIRELSDG